ncbi:ralA-binding protein 1-like [Diaphorina citri]|uniref:RalA-binding protein 1-like n=1 Tax=Diaphorina citri TaxID=121845 RepID=A0A3Q0IRJ2_DIACI|nr:ralA-binding protein 1-like [Diaphorina citri]
MLSLQVQQLKLINLNYTTAELLNKFEEVASVKDITVRENELKRLVDKLGSVNKMVLAWLLPHLNHVSQQEKCNKMSSQNIASVMSPVLQMSSKLLSALLFHCESILPHVELRQYVPPLTCTSPALPDTTPAIQEELKKQDSLLSQLHAEMNAGFVSKQREEQLWEVQRMITQLKRKLRVLEKGKESLSIPLTLNDNADPTSEIVKESMRLEIRKENLIRSIIEEREAILDLKVQILMKQGGSIPA